MERLKGNKFVVARACETITPKDVLMPYQVQGAMEELSTCTCEWRKLLGL